MSAIPSDTVSVLSLLLARSLAPPTKPLRSTRPIWHLPWAFPDSLSTSPWLWLVSDLFFAGPGFARFPEPRCPRYNARHALPMAEWRRIFGGSAAMAAPGLAGAGATISSSEIPTHFD